MRRRGPITALRVAMAAVGLTAAAIVYAFPLYWLIVTSLKSKSELFASTVHLLPHNPTLEPYVSVLIDRGFWVLLKNSVIVCAATVVITIAVGLLITYPPVCEWVSSTGPCRCVFSRPSP